jgi:hypothetical protein
MVTVGLVGGRGCPRQYHTGVIGFAGFDADRSLDHNVAWRGIRQTTPLPAEYRRRGRTKEINAMNVNSFGLDLADEQILIDELSDEALERAGGLENRAGLTIAMCSGLSSCPSAPA